MQEEQRGAVYEFMHVFPVVITILKSYSENGLH